MIDDWEIVKAVWKLLSDGNVWEFFKTIFYMGISIAFATIMKYLISYSKATLMNTKTMIHKDHAIYQEIMELRRSNDKTQDVLQQLLVNQNKLFSRLEEMEFKDNK